MVYVGWNRFVTWLIWKLNIIPLLQGLDVFNYVPVKTQITGSIPTISVGSEIEMDAFEEEYTRVKPGKVMPLWIVFLISYL